MAPRISLVSASIDYSIFPSWRSAQITRFINGFETFSRDHDEYDFVAETCEGTSITHNTPKPQCNSELDQKLINWLDVGAMKTFSLCSPTCCYFTNKRRNCALQFTLLMFGKTAGLQKMYNNHLEKVEPIRCQKYTRLPVLYKSVWLNWNAVRSNLIVLIYSTIADTAVMAKRDFD